MNDQLIELTDHELSHVSGGFLPLLGLLGMGSGLIGNILGGIGKKKSQEADQITKDAQGQGGGDQGQGQGQGKGQGQAQPKQQAGAGNLLGQPAQVQSSDG